MIAVPQVHATGYLENPFKLHHTPTLCVIEPQDEKIPYIGPMMLSITHDSVDEWLTQLNTGSGNKLIWNINEVQIPLSLQKEYNYTTCDIQMIYVPKPVNNTEIFETVGTISYDFKNGKSSVIIYYLEIENMLQPSANYGYESIPQYSKNTMDYFRLKQTISHELGHALGLGHYHEVNSEKIKKWIDGKEIPPSIMVEMQGGNPKYFGVTQNDVNQIKLKYGTNGFGDLKFIGIPHEIGKNTQLPDLTSDSTCINDPTVAFGSESLLTKTSTDIGINVLFQYSPNDLHQKCKNLWTIDFVDEKNTAKHMSNIYYDIFIQQDGLRSIAKEQGKNYFFAPEGKGINGIEVKEKEGVVYYWIVVYDTPPQHYTEGTKAGAALIFLNVEPQTIQKTVYTHEIAPWIKNVVRWWSTGQLQDSEFVEAIHYLINEKIINVNNVGSKSISVKHIPFWLKENAGWWADGQISDKEFLDEIQFMLDNGMIKS